MSEVKKSYADWVAVDWGTSNLRYWLMASNEVLNFKSIPMGMINLDQGSYEALLVKELDSFLDSSKVTTILICGMAGSRQGWKESPYMTVPCKPPEWRDAVTVKCQDSRISVRILPGLKQNIPADILRGEETQIRGLLEKYNDFDGVVCLPGTHTKWLRISAGEIVSFQTFMTGELFYLLSERSVLKHSVSKKGWDKEVFKVSVREIMCDNKLLASKLFALRADTILNNLLGCDARMRLSGYLIGLELSGSRPYWLGEKVFIVGEEDISRAYEIGLRLQGVSVFRDLGQDTTLIGLRAIHNRAIEMGEI